MESSMAIDGLLWVLNSSRTIKSWEANIDGYECCALQHGASWEVYTGCYVHLMDNDGTCFTVNITAVECGVNPDRFSEVARALLSKCLRNARSAFPCGIVTHYDGDL